jgi:sugar phosphate isomerase/epimerase
MTHIDVSGFDASAARRVHAACEQYGVGISGLGYYPNPLSADAEEAALAASHLTAVIDAAALLGVGVVNTFIGRDPRKTVDENWPRLMEVWPPIVRHAESRGVKLAIENCPMLFSADEWPGGKNIATTPAIWERLFADIPSSSLGLNLDPSHLILLEIDAPWCVRHFRDKLFHIHAKDLRIDREALQRHGRFAFPKLWHTPKLPGQGDVHWGYFLGALADAGYHGPVAVEVEDRAYEGSLELRVESLGISARYLRQYLASGASCV